jgi:hypothetical protein
VAPSSISATASAMGMTFFMDDHEESKCSATFD